MARPGQEMEFVLTFETARGPSESDMEKLNGLLADGWVTKTKKQTHAVQKWESPDVYNKSKPTKHETSHTVISYTLRYEG